MDTGALYIENDRAGRTAAFRAVSIFARTPSCGWGGR